MSEDRPSRKQTVPVRVNYDAALQIVEQIEAAIRRARGKARLQMNPYTDIAEAEACAERLAKTIRGEE